MNRCCLFVALIFGVNTAVGSQPLDVWPQLAPGESTRQFEEPLPPRAGESTPQIGLVRSSF
jgi:hypothetical protein